MVFADQEIGVPGELHFDDFKSNWKLDLNQERQLASKPFVWQGFACQ